MVNRGPVHRVQDKVIHPLCIANVEVLEVQVVDSGGGDNGRRELKQTLRRSRARARAKEGSWRSECGEDADVEV